MNESIEELLDKQAITEVLFRYCRGMDRMDRELTLSCWHEGGTDDHSPLYKGSAAGFVDWLWPVHEAMEGTRHFVSNMTIEVEGERAASESCWFLQLRIPYQGETYDLNGHGRYLDEFEKIDGIWAIRHRVSLGDMTAVNRYDLDIDSFDPPIIQPHGIPEMGPTSARDHSDFSYELFKNLRDSQ